MNIIKKDTKQVYAYGTSVTVTQSLEEIKRILKKFNSEGFQFTEDPFTKEIYITFLINSKHIGLIPIRIYLPRIYLDTQRIKMRFLEKESFRVLVLILKAKLQLFELGESIENIFLPNILINKTELLGEVMVKDHLPALVSGEKNLLKEVKGDFQIE